MSAGYSGTPLPQKLGIKNGYRVALIDPPPTLKDELTPLPLDVTIISAVGDAPLDVILLFVQSQSELEEQFADLAAMLQPTGGLWVCWPKKTSGVVSDLTGDTVRSIGLTSGLVDNKVCAIDAIWSGLRFVVRIKDRKRWRT